VDHQKGERVVYRNGIQDSQSFDQSETQKLSFFSTASLSSTDFSGVINAQNSVYFKPLVGWDCMSIQWKAGRVVQVFPIQLRGTTQWSDVLACVVACYTFVVLVSYIYLFYCLVMFNALVLIA
jgi:hypothetical protein